MQVETDSVLRPGTPGYRQCLVNAQRGNRQLLLRVGVTDGLLSAVVLDYELGSVDADPTRVVDTWTFGSPTDEPPPELLPPESYAED